MAAEQQTFFCCGVSNRSQQFQIVFEGEADLRRSEVTEIALELRRRARAESVGKHRRVRRDDHDGLGFDFDQSARKFASASNRKTDLHEMFASDFRHHNRRVRSDAGERQEFIHRRLP